jgi:hypothetical protein
MTSFPGLLVLTPRALRQQTLGNGDSLETHHDVYVNLWNTKAIDPKTPADPNLFLYPLVLHAANLYHTDPEKIPWRSLNRIYMASRLLPWDTFRARLEEEMYWAERYAKNFPEYLASIASGIYTPKINDEYWKFKPQTDIEIHYKVTRAQYHITEGRITISPLWKTKPSLRTGLAWRYTQAWRTAPESTRAADRFFWMKARAPKTRPNFPWKKISVKTLAQEIGYSERQTQTALRDGQRRGFHYRLIRGRPKIGSSVYLVFWTPSQSRAFQYKLLRTKAGPDLRPTTKKNIAIWKKKERTGTTPDRPKSKPPLNK